MSSPVEQAVTQAVVARAAEEAFAATIGALASRAQREVLSAGREKIQRSAPLWRRVTDGKPCGFCAMVASRGPVYGSAKSAGDGNRYHDHCGCTVEPFYGDPREWEPTPEEQRFIDAYYQSYEPGMSSSDLSARIEKQLRPVESPARFGNKLADVDGASLLRGPISVAEWEEMDLVGRANWDYRYLEPGSDRAQGVLMYNQDHGTNAKAVAANIKAGRDPFEGVDIDVVNKWTKKPEWAEWAVDGYGREDILNDLEATASWLVDQNPTPVGTDLYRGMNFPPEMSWDQVQKDIKTNGWNYTSTTKNQEMAIRGYAGRPDRSRSVVMRIKGAEGVELPGVGNFAVTEEVLVSGNIKITGTSFRDIDGWGERLFVEAIWDPEN